MKRKVIQIISVGQGVGDVQNSYVVALCDDGTIWSYQYGYWQLLQSVPE